ncbi:CopY/TcrY family copper transport repressor [Ignatzschineria cameli]|uniref:CopY/TcrY family copper transport repressor n=1 Tax=Ignatzschineria cameli TaxID=2182793 RepID=A0A2U2ATM4_9GAMM|nr:CopY/TcrY family copper transport repressor [Ignatzschineria cameli]PWD88072.1 CopY/TcrY family copper transport repressor [Ignatzschineria cameli]PWD91103.1 CopY/TcrY family copper transport repressor [Ignatzschineria cameli]PWD92744.1 CopY/TcrY family copper transport repressor [Ignatzschineria cameli]PWD93765.1 CopY/TcrY family copper transport repressor [Ignatzschineria cameli]
MTKNKISPAEYSIMQVLWSQNQATSQEMITILSKSTDWKPNTIQVMLSRLVSKGVVGIRKRGRYNVYFPTIAEGERSRHIGENAGHICARKIGSRIVEMIENRVLSFEDIAKIEKALEAKKAFAVEEVMCDCPPGTCTCKNCNCKREDRKFALTPANSQVEDLAKSSIVDQGLATALMAELDNSAGNAKNSAENNPAKATVKSSCCGG